MLELPDDLTDIIALADWLELVVISLDEKQTSISYLEDALQIPLDEEESHDLASEVVIELERRVRAAADSYPFVFDEGRVLQARTNLLEFLPYIFCLYISYFGWKPEGGDELDPRLMFEELSSLAAAEFVMGDVCLFGTSRRKNGVTNFTQAVEDLCIRLGEGGPAIARPALSPQDDHLDLVAWREFPDRRQSKLVLFGQCATGENWTEKLSELQPDTFWSFWISGPHISPLLRAFFMPHRVYEDDRWEHHAISAGILFDRCRVSLFAARRTAAIVADERYKRWCLSVWPFS